MPFVMLLLLVFLYRHLISILAFFWLTSMLHTANERMRRQAMLRENRSRRALLSVIGLLVAEIGAIFLMQNERLLQQLTLSKIEDFDKEPPTLSLLLWDVLLADLCARSAVLLLKATVAAIAPGSAARRLRRLFSAIEAVGVCYRMLLPMPLWFHWLFHAGENAENHATIWSVGCSHLYVGFKLVAMVDRVRQAGMACKAVLFVTLPMGKYASTEEVMELGEERECTICTDEHTNPVRLECGHIYCEECITSWCERNTGACTCPLCRAPIASTLGTHSDGTTALLPQVF